MSQPDQPRFRIAIVAALEREVRPLTKNWHANKTQHAGRTYQFFEHENVVLVCGGIGSDAARRATEAIIALYAPQIVYSIGFAGALNKNLKVGDIFLPKRIINASDGSSTEIDSGKDILITFASVASPQQKTKLAESFGARAVDMEAASVARAAEARGVRFAAVKVVSDEIDFAMPAINMERFVSPTGKFLTTKFAFFVLPRPWLWGNVAALAHNSTRASQALYIYLNQMLHRSDSQINQSVSAAKNNPVEAPSRR